MDALQELYRVFATQHLWFLHDLVVDYGIFLCISLGCYLTLMSGQISIGHGALASVGAYLTAILTVNLGFPVWLSMLLAGAAGAAVGLVVALSLALRLEGMYLAIATFAVGEILVVTWRNMDYVGGALGFLRIPLATTIWHVAIVVGGGDLPAVALREGPISGAPFAPPSTTSGRRWRWASTSSASRSTPGPWAASSPASAAPSTPTISASCGPVNFAFDYAVMILLAPTLGGYYTFWGTYIGAAVIIFAPWILNVTDPNYKRPRLRSPVRHHHGVFRPQGIIGWQGSRIPAVLRLLFRDRAAVATSERRLR